MGRLAGARGAASRRTHDQEQGEPEMLGLHPGGWVWGGLEGTWRSAAWLAEGRGPSEGARLQGRAVLALRRASDSPSPPSCRRGRRGSAPRQAAAATCPPPPCASAPPLVEVSSALLTASGNPLYPPAPSQASPAPPSATWSCGGAAGRPPRTSTRTPRTPPSACWRGWTCAACTAACTCRWGWPGLPGPRPAGSRPGAQTACCHPPPPPPPATSASLSTWFKAPPPFGPGALSLISPPPLCAAPPGRADPLPRVLPGAAAAADPHGPAAARQLPGELPGLHGAGGRAGAGGVGGATGARRLHRGPGGQPLPACRSCPACGLSVARLPGKLAAPHRA
jgi:hypothetical protein